MGKHQSPRNLAKLGRPLCLVVLALMLLPVLLSATAPRVAASPDWVTPSAASASSEKMVLIDSLETGWTFSRQSETYYTDGGNDSATKTEGSASRRIDGIKAASGPWAQIEKDLDLTGISCPLFDFRTSWTDHYLYLEVLIDSAEIYSKRSDEFSTNVWNSIYLGDLNYTGVHTVALRIDGRSDVFSAWFDYLRTGYPCLRTKDEDINTSWRPSPENQADAWCRWDTGELKVYGGCRIYWGADAAYRPTAYRIQVSDDGNNWTTVKTETEAAPASAWKEYIWTAKGRYIRLIVDTHGSSGTEIYEVDHTPLVDSPPNAPTDLLCGGRSNPEQVSLTPTFSAICADNDGGSDLLSYYAIQVDNDSDFSSLIWDSGKTDIADFVQGTRSPNIDYGGSALSIRETYYWQIKFWDFNDFEGAWSTEVAYFTTTYPPELISITSSQTLIDRKKDDPASSAITTTTITVRVQDNEGVASIDRVGLWSRIYQEVTYVSAGAAASSTGNITPALPAGWAQNDIFLLFVETANQVVSAPSGWAEVTNSPQGTGSVGGSTATRITVFWRRATADESAPTITDPGNHVIGRILAFRGCFAPGDPWDVTAGDVRSAASTSVTIPGATTIADNCMVVVVVAHTTDTTSAQTSEWANTNLTGLVEVVDSSTTRGYGGGFGVAVGTQSVLNYGPTTATLETSSAQGRMSIALVGRVLCIDNLELTSYTDNSATVRDFTYVYDPPDNLPNDNLGSFDVNVVVEDIWGASDTNNWGGDGPDLFTVDDTTTPINIDPASPYYLWEVNVSGTVTRIAGTASTDNVWLKDNVTNVWWYLGSGNDWSKEYTVNYLQNENVEVTVRICDPPLDGLFTSSYVVNENWQFQINLRWEDNFEMFPADSIEGRDIYAIFHYRNYEDEERQLTKNSENSTTSFYPDWLKVRFGAGSENEYLRTYMPPKENLVIDAIGVRDEDLPNLSLYTITLNPEMGVSQFETWGPPNGIIGIYKFHGYQRYYIHKQYWSGTGDAAIWLKFGYDYDMYIEGVDTGGVDYGFVSADTVYRKVLYPTRLGLYENVVALEPLASQISWSYGVDAYGNLVVKYQDNTGGTNWVLIEVIDASENYEIVWYNNHDETPNGFEAICTEVSEDHIYDIRLTIDHDNYGFSPVYASGLVGWEGDLPEYEGGNPGDAFGHLGNLPTAFSAMAAFGVAIVVMAAFGPAVAGLGIIMAGLVLGFLKVMGIALAIPWAVIAFVILVGVISQIMKGRGR